MMLPGTAPRGCDISKPWHSAARLLRGQATAIRYLR